MRLSASRVLALAATIAVAGCGGRGAVISEQLPAASAATTVELHGTPFFPQRRYQCGPAALATVLAASGVAVSPDALVAQVYLPGRQGSLQTEIVAATRRHDRVAYPVAPNLRALLAELRAHNPVLVLLNLGVGLFPVWHYAVVVGYDAERNVVVLRSGTTRRRVMSARDFERSWARAGSWAILALEPGETPASDAPAPYLDAVADLESTGRLEAARAGYEGALRRWPRNATALFGLANTDYRLGRLDESERTYRRLVHEAPDHVPAWNNLASLLLERGCPGAAREAIERAVAAGGGDSPYADAIETTRREVAAAKPDAAGARAACTP